MNAYQGEDLLNLPPWKIAGGDQALILYNLIKNLQDQSELSTKV